MPRALRPQIANGIYHVMSRGNRRQDIYVDAADRKYFLQLADRNRDRYQWLVHAYCLMTNHYHLLVETPGANISAAMQRLNAMYAEWFNWRHRVSGHLFQGRFHSVTVTTNLQFVEVCRYIVLNPVRAGLCDHPADYRWSSYRTMAAGEAATDFLAQARLVELFGGEASAAADVFKGFVEAGIDRAVQARTGHVPGLTPALAA